MHKIYCQLGDLIFFLINSYHMVTITKRHQAFIGRGDVLKYILGIADTNHIIFLGMQNQDRCFYGLKLFFYYFDE